MPALKYRSSKTNVICVYLPYHIKHLGTIRNVCKTVVHWQSGRQSATVMCKHIIIFSKKQPKLRAGNQDAIWQL